MDMPYLELMLVTQPAYLPYDQYLDFIRRAVAGGVTAVQLRNKIDSSTELKTFAQSLLNMLRPLNIPLIINDNVDFAKEIDADGVHLGQSDRSPIYARSQLGPNKIIGWSIETLNDLSEANQLDCLDYIAASAVFPSKNKQDCNTIWGLAGLLSLTKKSKHPVIAIGGINLSNVRAVMDCGASGVAVISAIHTSRNPEFTSNQLIQEIKNGRTN